MKFVKVMLVSLVLVMSSWAKETPIEINFKDLEISDFIQMVSKITHKNILLSAQVPGKVNFVSVKPINKQEIYDLLISVLRSKGFTLVDSQNGYLEVVRGAESSQLSPVLLNAKGMNQIQTDIIGIENLDAALLLPQIKFLQSKYGKGIVAKNINAVVLTDYPKNLQAIKALIRKMDTNEAREVTFVKLQYASSAAVLPKLIKIVTAQYDPKIENQKVELLQDEGSNTLVVIAKKEQMKLINGYIEALDQKDEVAEERISIVSLKNSDAEAMAKTLEAIIAGKKYGKDDPKPKITADKETNTLIIISSQKEMVQLSDVIKSLDVDRQQVFVRARIIEISNDKATAIGAKYGIFGGMTNSSGLYSFSANMGGSAIPFDLGKIGLDIPNITEGLALGATISLLNTQGAADILSEPSLLCINNLESSIYVGQTESIISQGTVGSSTTDVNRNTYTRQDIGLTLTIKPRISTDNKVTLDVKTILEDIVPGGEGTGLPTTTKREVKTTAIVNNGESIIIGGLVREKVDSDETKVPLLGDIPLVGEVFTHREKNHDKVSLVVMLTPYIVSKSTDLGKLRDALGQLSGLEDQVAKQFEAKEAGKVQ